MAINLDDIISAATATSQQQQAQTNQMAGLQAKQGDMGRSVANNMRKEADLRMSAELTKQQALVEAQKNAREHATAMGMNGVSMSEIITSTSQQLRADHLAYQAASKKVQEIEANSNLLANPMGWLNDLLNGDQARATRDAIKERHATTASQLNNMHALTQTNVQTQMSIAETANADTVRQIAEANRLLAESNAQEAEINALSYTVDSINTLRQFGSSEFNRRLQIYNAVTQESRHQQQMEAMNRRLEMEKAEMDSWEYTAQNINIARRAQGLEELPEGVIRRDYGSNTPQGQKLLEMEMIGQASRDSGSARVGLSPGHSMFMLQENGGVLPGNLGDEVAENLTSAFQTMQEEAQEAAQLPSGTTEHGLTKDNYNDRSAQIEAVNSIFRAQQQEADAKFGSRAMPVNAIAEEFPSITQNAVFQKYVKPLVDAGNPQLTPEDVVTNAASLYKQGEVTESEAVQGIVSMAQGNLDLYNALSGRTAIGAQMPTEFKVALPTGESRRSFDPRAFLFSPLALKSLKSKSVYEEVDLLNPTDVSHFLQRYRSNAVAREMHNNAEAQRSNNSQTGSGN